MQVLGPVEAQLLEHIEEHLEVILLLRPYHIEQGIERPVLVPGNSSAYILGDVYRCAVPPEQNLGI